MIQKIIFDKYKEFILSSYNYNRKKRKYELRIKFTSYDYHEIPHGKPLMCHLFEYQLCYRTKNKDAYMKKRINWLIGV